MKIPIVASLIVLLSASALPVQPFELPQFAVPGFETDMQTLNRLHALHHEPAFSHCTLWDGWLPHATVWASPTKRAQYLESLQQRRIDDDGYVAMQQHRGMAHSDGWPFPAWQQSTGVGFHFSTRKDGWAIQNFSLQPLQSAAGWEIEGAEVLGIDGALGLQLKASHDRVTITTPPFRCGTIVAPFARIEWAAQGLPTSASVQIQWQLEGESTWVSDRFAMVETPREADGMHFANIPLYQAPGYAGMLTRYRIAIDHANGSTLQLQSILTAIDTRHPITNSLFIRACCDTFRWTKDVRFLQQTMPRLRHAMQFALDEFQLVQEHHVVVPWVGHDGRSGLVFDADGRKSLRPGMGVGNNYWDLLPFGAHDAIATMYLFDAIACLSELEREIARHPDWNISSVGAYPLEFLERLAEEVREDFQVRFWSQATGRFVGWIDRDGRAYDYGFTFVNLEAIHYGLASEEQAKSILAWIDGTRLVAGDTSQGPDIYRWRFAPRATTKRNIETYVWVWSHPESIPWGDQVQDGGAVLGFSYFDLMARLKGNGPDDAWNQLQAILAWFREVESEGGYRSYYAQPGRGVLQGGGPPGGLGLDHEFMESVLVPQIMLYGFLGFQPTADGYRIQPRLPSDWPSLSVTGIRIGDTILDITAYPDGRIDSHPHGE